MCLSTVYRGKQKKDFLAKLPAVITVWKVAVTNGDAYWPEFYRWTHGDYCTGVNIFVTDRICADDGYYKGGCHFFLSRSTAERWKDYGQTRIKCSVFKKDITAVGAQNDRAVCIVARKATFPKYCGDKK